MVARFSANVSENCSEAVSGRLLGSRGKFKTMQAFYSNSVRVKWVKMLSLLVVLIFLDVKNPCLLSHHISLLGVEAQ